MNCQDFQSTFAPQTEDAALLEHLRTCDACLDYALGVDPDVFFRAAGSAEVIPPGGVDAFVGDVMRELRLRNAETATQRPVMPMWRRYAAAAAIVIGIGSGWLLKNEPVHTAVPAQVQVTRPSAVTVLAVASRPVVESYQSANATIVEVPAEGAGDVKLVMIFDENLPKDL